MSDLLAIGASGVRAYQTALTTTSENISNSGVAGYSRRTVQLSEVALPAVNSKISNGLGVTITGVSRAADDFKANDVRSSGADLARTQTGTTYLSRIDSALSGSQLGDRLTSFFNASTTLASDPTSAASRATMLESAQSVATAFTSTGTALANAASDLDASANAAVTQLNGLSAALAKVNDGLSRAPAGSATSASLLDQRDQLLETMSAITDVSATYDSAGRVTVRSGGDTSAVLVQGTTSATVTYARNEEGAVAYTSKLNGTTSALTPNGGALAGYGDAAQKIADAQSTLNTQAQAFSDGVNAVQAAGEDQDGTAGQAMFSTGTPASNMTLTLSDPRGIAAAAVGGGTRDNSNLAGFATLRTTGNVEGAITDLTASNAASIAAKNNVASAQGAIHDTAVAARDAVSGVNIDEEAVDLIRFQQAYQASSRVIQVARDTFQSILDIR